MEKRTVRQMETALARPKRTPLGSRNILKVEPRAGYHRVWVSDSSSLRPQLVDYIEAGYTYVEAPTIVGDKSANMGEPVLSRVTRPGGQGVMLYLLEIPEEYYQEDQKLAEDKIRDKELQMFDPKSIDAGYGHVDQTRDR